MTKSSPLLRSLTLGLAAAGLGVALAGCTYNHGGSRNYRYDISRETGATYSTYATEPAPAAEPRTAPAPAATPMVVGGRCPSYSPAAGADRNVTMMAFPTGDPASSALGVFQVMPKEVRANTTYTYEIHATNLTSASLQNVIVADVGAENFTIVSSEPSAGRGEMGRLFWDLGDLGPCETKVIRVTARSGATGVASNCIVADYNNRICAVTNVVEPKLEITKSAPAEVLLCDNIPLTFTVKNAGTATLQNVVISDPLPNGWTGLDGATTLSIPVGTLAPGESRPANATVKSSRTGRFENQATAKSADDVTATSNRTSTVIKQPKLTITCDAEGSEFVGRTLTIRYTVRNTGDVACSPVLTSNLASGVNFQSATNGGAVSGGNVVWNLGSLEPGASTTVSMDVVSSTIQTVRSSATVTCPCADPASVECTSEVRGVPAVLLEVVDLVDPVELGTETTYVITVTNQGSAQDTNITMRVELPPNFEFVSAGGATQATRTGNVTEFAPFASLAPGASIEWRVVARAKTQGNIRTKFTMTTAETRAQGSIEETESTTLYD